MTTAIAQRRHDLCEQHLPYECCSCPLSRVNGEKSVYHCDLLHEKEKVSEPGPKCLGRRVKIKVSGNEGEISVVRIKGDLIYFRVTLDDGRIVSTVPSDCETIDSDATREVVKTTDSPVLEPKDLYDGISPIN